MLLTAAAMLLLASPPSVRDGGADLRDSCSADAASIALLSAGSPVSIRFAFSGDIGTCYKVTTQSGQQGYLLPAEIDGLEEYEHARRLASDRELPLMIRSELSRLRTGLGDRPSVAGAIQLIETGQPREALRMIEDSLLPAHRRDAYILALAGLAAYQCDQPRQAADYWSDSLAIQPSESVEKLYLRARRELKSDTSRERLAGRRFLLRYDNSGITPAIAAQVLDALDAEYDRIDAALGCAIREQIVAVVQTEDAYRATTDAAAWSGGQFDGRIRVYLPGGSLTPSTRQALAHEIVHACLARNGAFPVWFHEGMAQRWSGQRPAGPYLANAATLVTQPALTAKPEDALLFYAWSWLAVDKLYRRLGEPAIRNLIRDPEALLRIASN